MRNCNLIILAFCLLLACATTSVIDNPLQNQAKVKKLLKKLEQDPNDSGTLCEIGVVCVQLELYQKACMFLIRALKIEPQNPEILFYLGFCLESINKMKQALEIYAHYTDVSPLSPYRGMMQGRYQIVTRELLRQEMHALVSQEQEISDTNLPSNTIAIFPLTYHGKNPEYAELGKGLSEMMITDLSQVPDLDLIERIRLNALIEEMSLAEVGMVNMLTAPKLGNLLRAGKIIGGAYNTLDDDKLSLEVQFWDIRNIEEPASASKTDVLTNLFRLEKLIVLGLIKNMGISLTPVQREKILIVPTKNLHAFMSYCKGLASEDAGHFEEAIKFYQQAVSMDPQFRMADQKIQESRVISQVDVNKRKIADIARHPQKPNNTQSKPFQGPNTPSLVSQRLQNISRNMGATFMPGTDSRKATEEAAASGADVGLGDLPDPPKPPGWK